tara:strand:- start:55143 stop:55373 length:231 start_codon:yes stop_codon:yes gene_type:complete
MTNNKNRRVEKTPSEQELYKISKSSIKIFIEEERRFDELDKLREVQMQSRVWKRTVAFCGFLNLILISLALWGMYK